MSTTALAASTTRPSVPASAPGPDPYAGIETLSASARTRAYLLGVLISLVLVAIASAAAALYTTAVFGYPGGGS